MPHQRRYAYGKQAYENMLSIMSLEKNKLKQKQDTAIYLLEWLKLKTLTPPNIG